MEIFENLALQAGTAGLTGALGWFFGRKRQAEENKSLELGNVDQVLEMQRETLDFYQKKQQEIIDNFEKKLSDQQAAYEQRMEQLQEKNDHSLKEALTNQHHLQKKIESLTATIIKYKEEIIELKQIIENYQKK
jgi:ElaB/YqjD/DUF883 family membrane-anchored ribosome-binding protein